MFICSPIRNTICFFILLFLSSANALKAQDKGGSNDSVILSFIKKEAFQSSDSLYFNVLKIQNISSEKLSFQPKIHSPSDWTLLSVLPKQINLKPGSSKLIPFRIGIPKNAVSAVAHPIKGQVRSLTDVLLAETSCFVRVKQKRNWQMEFLSKEVMLLPGRIRKGKFKIHLQNNGNVQEDVKLKFTLPEGISVYKNERKKEKLSLSLKPGSDTILSLHVESKSKKNMGNHLNIWVQAGNDLKEVKKRFNVKSYSSHFDYLPQHVSLSSYVEYSRRIQTDGTYMDQMNIKGVIPLNKENRINYYYLNYNLNNLGRMWDNSHFQLDYESKNISAGIGQSRTNLGVDLYNPRSLFGNVDVNISPSNKLKFHVSRGIDQDITCTALGYRLQLNKFYVQASTGYNHNVFRGYDVASYILSGNLPLGKYHTIGGELSRVERESFANKPYSTSGYGGRANHNLKIGKSLYFSTNGRFYTPGYYFRNQGQIFLKTRVRYLFKKSRNSLSFEYKANRRVNKVDLNSTLQSSESEYLSEIFKLGYDFGKVQKFNFEAGLSVNQISSTKVQNNIDLQSKNLWLHAKKTGEISSDLFFEYGYMGIKHQKMFGGEFGELNMKIPNIHFSGRIKTVSLGLVVKYDEGLPAGSNSYSGNEYRVLRISPYWRTNVFDENLRLELYTDYYRDLSQVQSNISLRSRLEYNMKSNWTFKLEGYLNASGVQLTDLISQTYRPTISIGIRKSFNIRKKKKKEDKFHNVGVVFFRDENKNGSMDADEQGVINGLVKMEKESTQNNDAFVDLNTLVSGGNGKVDYENIPQGEYSLDIKRLSNPDGYFNFGNSQQNVKVTSDTVCYIPYVKAYRIMGDLKIMIANISSGKLTKLANIRVTATDRGGEEYSSLTDRTGHFILPVAGKDEYIVSINNPYGRRVNVINQNSKVDFNNSEEEQVNFEFVEKRRKVNMKKAKSYSSRKQKRNVQNGRTKDLPKDKKELINDNKPTNEVKALNKGSRDLKNSNSSKKTVNAKDSWSKIDYWIYSRIVDGGIKRESYWVVGGFRDLTNAEGQADKLKENGIDASILFDEEKKLYYVYLSKATISVIREKLKIIPNKNLEEIAN